MNDEQAMNALMVLRTPLEESFVPCVVLGSSSQPNRWHTRATDWKIYPKDAFAPI